MAEDKDGADRRIVLGLLSAPHLGDTLCTTPLPRLLSEHQERMVYVIDHPSTRSLFANNPYVSGFERGRHVRLHRKMRGSGHVIQRLQQGFRLPMDLRPKPEIYLSDEERQWARQQRADWPGEKPACLMASRAITDEGHYRTVDWDTMAEAWAASCTLVQPILTSPQAYVPQVANISQAAVQQWSPEDVLADAVLYRDLPLRKYLALFSVTDFFLGPTSGGTHVAAAFDVPALVVTWEPLYSELEFPCTGRPLCPGSFLYPQQEFLSVEQAKRIDLHKFVQEFIQRHGKK